MTCSNVAAQVAECPELLRCCHGGGLARALRCAGGGLSGVAASLKCIRALWQPGCARVSAARAAIECAPFERKAFREALQHLRACLYQ